MPVAAIPPRTPFGLTLKAWGVFDFTVAANANALVKGGGLTALKAASGNGVVVTFATAMASTKYTVIASGDTNSGSGGGGLGTASTLRVVGSCKVECWTNGGTGTAPDAVHFEFWE